MVAVFWKVVSDLIVSLWCRDQLFKWGSLCWGRYRWKKTANLREIWVCQDALYQWIFRQSILLLVIPFPVRDYKLLIHAIYWSYNPFTNHLLTSWDIISMAQWVCNVEVRMTHKPDFGDSFPAKRRSGRFLQRKQFFRWKIIIPTWSSTARPWKGTIPKGNSLPTIHFQGRAVELRGCLDLKTETL